MANANSPVQVTVDIGEHRGFEIRFTNSFVKDIEECARGLGPDNDGPGPRHPGLKPKPSSDRTKMPGCNHAVGSRNLIVCIDGTANQFGDKVRVWGTRIAIVSDVVM